MCVCVCVCVYVCVCMCVCVLVHGDSGVDNRYDILLINLSSLSSSFLLPD